MTKNTAISKGMAKWIEDFVTSLNPEKQLSKEAENNNVDINENVDTIEDNNDQDNSDFFGDKTAAINISDLPKVVWNDETFYVLFDEETGKATILNEFTNVVITVSARTIEEVDEALNGLQIVRSNAESALEKNAKEDDELDSLDDEIEYADETDEADKADEVDAVDKVEPFEINETESDEISQLKSQVDALTEQIAILQQEYARIKELSNLDIGAQEAEVEHFNETAQETAQQISEEEQIDFTTPEGRTQLRQNILDELNETIGEEVDEIVQEEVVSLDGIDNNVEEIDSTESDLGEKDYEEAQPIDLESPSVVNEQSFMDDQAVEEDKLSNFSEEEDNEDEFEKLSGKDANIFKKAVCPSCGGNLLKANKFNNIQGIYCDECKGEYAVNMDNEDIYKKRGDK